jgi:hypothetical protein
LTRDFEAMFQHFERVLVPQGNEETSKEAIGLVPLKDAELFFNVVCRQKTPSVKTQPYREALKQMSMMFGVENNHGSSSARRETSHGSSSARIEISYGSSGARRETSHNSSSARRDTNHGSSGARRDTNHGSAKKEEKSSSSNFHVSVPRVALLVASLHRTSIEEEEESHQRQQGFLSPTEQQQTLQLKASGTAATSSVDQPGSSGKIVGALGGDQPKPHAAADRSRRASVEEFLQVGVEQDSDSDDVDTGVVADETQDSTTVVREDEDTPPIHADQGKSAVAVGAVAVAVAAAAETSNTPQPADDEAVDNTTEAAESANVQVNQ